MIARHWRGWTKLGDAEGYEDFLKQKVLPGLDRLEGYRGGYVLREDGAGETEFVAINFFESLEAVMRFAGEEFTVPVFEPEAKAFLSRIQTAAHHYEVRASTTGPRRP